MKEMCHPSVQAGKVSSEYHFRVAAAEMSKISQNTYSNYCCEKKKRESCINLISLIAQVSQMCTMKT